MITTKNFREVSTRRTRSGKCPCVGEIAKENRRRRLIEVEHQITMSRIQYGNYCEGEGE